MEKKGLSNIHIILIAISAIIVVAILYVSLTESSRLSPPYQSSLQTGSDYPPSISAPKCGDGSCNGRETCSSCRRDCGSCFITPANETNQTHSICSNNNSCLVVQGPGNNECNNNNNDCEPETHMGCSNNACVVIQGSGQDTCSTNGDCQNSTNVTHLECVSQSCTVVQGPGINGCSPEGVSCGNSTNGTLPDLIVQTITTIIGNGTNNSYDALLIASIKNIGDGFADLSTTRFFVTPVGGSQLIFTPALFAGQSTVVSSSYILPEGNYTAVVNADWFNNVQESNNANNELVKTFEIP